MKTIVIVNCNAILNNVQDELLVKYNAIGFRNKEDLSLEALDAINPDYVFFLHWSWIIPESIYNKFNCVVFHMTDLPFGRGGSPLQNLIIRGIKKTKISAIKVTKGIDTGDIYQKAEMLLDGTATETFLRAGGIISKMIEEITVNNPEPVKQSGTPVYFKRRKPEESIIDDQIVDINKLYDFIRMLDADNYPHAFLDNGIFKFDFTNAQIINENELIANVRIIKK